MLFGTACQDEALDAHGDQLVCKVVANKSTTAKNADPVNLHLSIPLNEIRNMEYLPDWLTMQDLILYLLLGAVAGVVAGLLGVGGGLVIVPALIWIFISKGFDGAIVAHLAVGTSLVTIVATSISSIHAHHRRGAVRWELVMQLLPGILVGAWLGVVIADALPTLWLKRVFALFVVIVGLRMLITVDIEGHRELPGRGILALVGSVIGTISAIVGIGGGTMTVPFLNWCRVNMQQAVATSSACGLPIAAAGGIGFVVVGLDEQLLPAGTSGYIYWPAVLGIVLASVLFAPLGACLSHNLPSATLKRIFALLLFLIGGRMVL